MAQKYVDLFRHLYETPATTKSKKEQLDELFGAWSTSEDEDKCYETLQSTKTSSISKQPNNKNHPSTIKTPKLCTAIKREVPIIKIQKIHHQSGDGHEKWAVRQLCNKCNQFIDHLHEPLRCALAHHTRLRSIYDLKKKNVKKTTIIRSNREAIQKYQRHAEARSSTKTSKSK